MIWTLGIEIWPGVETNMLRHVKKNVHIHITYVMCMYDYVCKYIYKYVYILYDIYIFNMLACMNTSTCQHTKIFLRKQSPLKPFRILLASPTGEQEKRCILGTAPCSTS